MYQSINVLGLIFDSKMQWSDHIAHAIKRSMTAPNAISLIRKFFTQKSYLASLPQTLTQFYITTLKSGTCPP